jgi:hypothetical protein
MAPARVLGPSDGHLTVLGGTNARFLIQGEDAGKRFSLVEHPMQPRALAAPMHRHHREDEYSFVLDQADRRDWRVTTLGKIAYGRSFQVAMPSSFLN